MNISVVIAAYNAAATIERAVRSVLAQTRPADEILVVNDGSEDNTASLAAAVDGRVRVISQSNGGASAARNAGIAAAKGDWIAFLDADDYWLPEKLACQEKLCLKYPASAWSYTNLQGFDGHRIYNPSELPDRGPMECQFDDYLKAYSQGYFASTITLLIRKEACLKAGLFVPGMKRGQDTDLWFRIAYRYPQIAYISRPLAVYDKSTPGSSTKKNSHYQYMIDLIDRHLTLSLEAGRAEAFAPCAAMMLQEWIRDLTGRGCSDEAGALLRRYGHCLSSRFLWEARCRVMLPVVGPRLADWYLAVKNKVKSSGV